MMTKNKLRKVKFFNTSLIEDWILFLTPYNMLASFIFLGLDIPKNFKIYVLVGILVFFIVSYVILWNKFNGLNEIKFKINNSNVKIKIGDIFEEEGLKVIAFNEYFDTKVDNKIISESSLNGKYIKKYINTSSKIKQLDTKIEKDKRLEKNLILEKDNIKKREGKIKRYNLGSSILINDFILVSFSRFDEENRAYLNKNDYINCLLKFWDEIDIINNGKDVVIPLLGSGITRYRESMMFSDQDLLEVLIWSLKVSKIKFVDTHTLTFIIHESKKEQIDLYKIKKNN